MTKHSVSSTATAKSLPPLVIDGSYGEGGGQIVRSSLALSLVTGRPIVVQNIRGGREKPGLMRQHLTAVMAAAQIGTADVAGNAVGSTDLVFTPGRIIPGDYRFSVGTAGSATLVLQTVLPALALATGPSRLVIEGGTHNQWAPPFDFLERSFLPMINRMGPCVQATLNRHGFYPAGGGQLTVTINPSSKWDRLDLPSQGATVRRSAVVLISNLSRQIAEREATVLRRRLNLDAAQIRIVEVDAHGPGNLVYIEDEYERLTEIVTAFGRIGASAEQVATEAVKQFNNYLSATAPVGVYLADQLLLPMGISAWQESQNRENATSEQRGGGSFVTGGLSRHATTQIALLQQFLNIDIGTEVCNHTRTTTVRVGAADRKDVC